ncbi:fungal-specific transcription factor domain-domain-containing protein [Phakopsora pachyrhizi]|uniref:Fungal-specific transcription factor domain-domain-containing protein n=1 Tax=Phakopsora pachyrhizi TaxID=170000 RepID=A0AAV0B561_PHAPC|nr:fungal-specific transcription factor domain-domain-containing protein [Phakopsora pachyrhizi]
MDPIIKSEPSYWLPKEQAEQATPSGSSSRRRPRHRLSCAECRRLKLKCDRVWPCSSCTKRGCARICPEGTLQAKVRSKDTSVLLSKIAELENLLREKDLLLSKESRDTTQVSSEPSDSLFETLNRQSSSSAESNSISVTQDPNVLSLIDGIGTLNLSGDGRSHFLGLSASSAFFDGDCSDNESVFSAPSTSEALDEKFEKGSTFRFFASTSQKPFDIKKLKSVLPDRREAERLGSVYHNFVYNIYGLNTPNEFHELLEEVYNDPDGDICMTRVALLSLGVLFDPAVHALHSDARKWHEAAEAALMTTDYLTNPTISSVQAIHLVGISILNSRTDATEAFWPIIGIALRLCQSMGLHRDGSYWGLEAPELESRRRIFHELLSLDRLQSLVLGRPYAISDKHYDTQIPECNNNSNLPSIQFAEDFSVYKWKFSSCIGHVVDDAFSVSPPSLAVINRLDSEIRNFDSSLPSHLRFPLILPISGGPKWPEQASIHPNFGAICSNDLRSTMRQHFMAMLENQTLLFLHRRAFALALSEPGSEPLRSNFARSVLSVITESSYNLIMIAKSAQTTYPELANRWWHLFSNAYSGATCVATLLIKLPMCGLAKQAWSSLTTAMSVFIVAAQYGPLCKDLLSRLTKLQRQAVANLNAFTSGDPASRAMRLLNQNLGLRSLGLPTGEEASAPLPNFLDSGCNSYVKGLKIDIPCELGASTRLIRKNRTQSISNSSIASGRRKSVSSSRSRVPSFGSSSPNDLSFSIIRNCGSTIVPPAAGKNPIGINNSNSCSNSALSLSLTRPFWGGIPRSQNDGIDDETNRLAYWENLNVEPTNEVINSPIFGNSHPQSMNYFATIPEHFHPPMILPSEEIMVSGNISGGGFGMYSSSASFESASHNQPTSPSLLSMSSSTAAVREINSSREALTSPINTQFDLLDTFLTW